MKQILIVILITLVIACGGDGKNTQETIPSPTPTHSDQIPTQDMLDSGKMTFNKSCFTCHENTVGEVTMLTNMALLTEYDSKQLEKLLQHVIKGYTGDFGTMPPNGACWDCSEDELRNAILYTMTKTDVLE